MPTTYSKADHLQLMLTKVINKWHPDLKKYEVTFDIFTAHGDSESSEPALKHHGYAAAAVVKINNLQNRVGGLADVCLTLDGDRWEKWSHEQQLGLLDHECEHVEVVVKDSVLKTDDAGRPKLRLRLHDHEVGVFESIIRRHGRDSLDLLAVEPLHAFAQQFLFPLEESGVA